MADVQLAVGVRRTVVQHEAGPAVARLAQPLVDALVAPGLDPARLALGQVAAHRERRVGQVQRLAVVDRRSGACSVGAGASAMAMDLSGRAQALRRSHGVAGDRLAGADGRRGGRILRCRAGVDARQIRSRVVWRPVAACSFGLGGAARRAPPRRRRGSRRRAPRASRSALRRAVWQAAPRGRVYRSPPRCRGSAANRRQCVSSRTRPLSSTVGRRPRLATPSSGASPRPWTRATKMPMRRRARMREAQVQGAKAVAAAAAAFAERAAELARRG